MSCHKGLRSDSESDSDARQRQPRNLVGLGQLSKKLMIGDLVGTVTYGHGLGRRMCSLTPDQLKDHLQAFCKLGLSG